MRTANGLWNREKFLHRPLAVFISQQDSLAQTDLNCAPIIGRC